MRDLQARRGLSKSGIERLGNTGLGPYRTVMTLYALRCAGAVPASSQVFMDPYHRYTQTAAVPGFRMAAGR